MIRNTVFVVLMLLAIGAGVLWWRSYRPVPCVRGQCPPSYEGWSAQSYRYGWGLFQARGVGGTLQVHLTQAKDQTPGVSDSMEYRVGPLAYYGRTREYYRNHTLVVPLWLMTGLLLSYPMYALVRERMVRRRLIRAARKEGLCKTCEYDLTGNVSGVCPECGEAT